MKDMMQSISSTTWVGLRRSRIFYSRMALLLLYALAAARAGSTDRSSPRLGLDHLQVPGRVQHGALFERSHRGFHAARTVRHAGGGEPHLDAGQGAKQSELVALAEMADAKHFSSELAEARTKR